MAHGPAARGRLPMNVLKSVETTIANLLEGTFGRIFRSEVRPVELARKLAREMDEHRTESLSRTYAPNEFSVWLSPRDRARYEEVEREMIDELCGYLLEHARRERLILPPPPPITFPPARGAPDPAPPPPHPVPHRRAPGAGRIRHPGPADPPPRAARARRAAAGRRSRGPRAGAPRAGASARGSGRDDDLQHLGARAWAAGGGAGAPPGPARDGGGGGAA